MRIFTALILAGLLIFGLACSDDPVSSTTINGSHTLITADRDIPNFTSIRNRLDADISVAIGPEQEVEITVDDNIADYIVLSVTTTDELVIRTDPDIELSDYDLTIKITMTELSSIAHFGVGDITSSSPLNLDQLAIQMSGAGTIDLDLNAGDVTTTLSGTGNIILRGSAESHICNHTGTGILHAFDLETVDTEIALGGTGYAEVFAVEKLDIDFEGDCCLYYRGNPEIDQSGSGIGNIIDSNP